VILANVRTPDERKGDLGAQLAATLRATERLKALAERRREERVRMLTASGADLVTLETDADYALPLRKAFALRARRIHRG